MKPVKTLNVLGEQVDIMTNGEMTNGASTFVIQTTRPGGGPPPHMHTREDETFTVLEGDFEILDNGKWRSVVKGEFIFSPRGSIHTFRNSGTTVGRMAVFIAPAGFEQFFEQIEGLTPSNMLKLLQIANKFGLSFHL
jgi:quercetin dioxygenase-like cupin family protein